MNSKNVKLGIIGLGYVGLPLAVEFGKKFKNVIGFDLKRKRIKELRSLIDITEEVSKRELKSSKNLSFSYDLKDIETCNCYIVAVPTPVNSKKKPDFKLLKNASKIVGNVLKKNDVIIFESTVYPGATEEICVPILEKTSKLKFNVDFFVGYSPERINPGDKKHTIKNIIKIVSGSNVKITKFVSDLYSKIVKAGTHEVSSIKVAEAAKVIENTQRDLNIALINELSIIFKKLNLNTEEVLRAAETKWNFISFRPGLVGGHCIGIDPYYLTHKSKKIGYNPKIILAGRNLNDHMPNYVGDQILKKIKKLNQKKNRILIMGLSFKENCPDIRNSKIFDLHNFLLKQNIDVDVFDPVVDKKEKEISSINLVKYPRKKFYDCIILAVKHDDFVKMTYKEISSFNKRDGIIYDLKYIFNKIENKNYYRL